MLHLQRLTYTAENFSSWQQVLCYKYQYQYRRSKYQYLACKCKYLENVRKYSSITSTSTKYNKTR